MPLRRDTQGKRFKPFQTYAPSEQIGRITVPSTHPRRTHQQSTARHRTVFERVSKTGQNRCAKTAYKFLSKLELDYARKGDEHLVFAIGAANSGKAFLQIAALEKGSHRLLDDWPPVTVLLLKTLVVDLLEGVKMFIEQSPQVGGLGIAWMVERSGLDTGGDHGRNRSVYM